MVLAQHNCPGWPWLVKASAALSTCSQECSKYDLTAAQCFRLVIIMIGPGSLLLVVPHLLVVLQNCRFFKGLEITRTNGCLILSEIFRKKTRIHPWFHLQNSNNQITLLQIVTIHTRLIEFSVKSWSYWALVWPSNPCFILNSSVVVKWANLGTVSWNNLMQILHILLTKISIICLHFLKDYPSMINK